MTGVKIDGIEVAKSIKVKVAEIVNDLKSKGISPCLATVLVGDNPGGRERVSVTPLSSPNIAGPANGASVVVNVSGNILTQDFVEGELAENIKEAIRRGTDFGIS